MALIDDLKKYKYIGMPFHSPSWPTPTYSHLVASDDGFNWVNLKDYNFGWRDADVHYIDGVWWVCYTTAVCYTTDFETFTNIEFPHPQFKSVWAPEFFQDKDGQWYLIYNGGNGSDDDWHIYMNKFYPEEKRLDATPLSVQINENVNWIDANLNYIDGYYYLWACYSTEFPHELRLYKSSSLLGTYNRINTNITERVKEAGMVIDEAPEMMRKDGRYILYSDPYYHGLPELDRCVQYSISSDMVNWSSLTKVTCTGGYNPRHFTPYYIGDIDFDGNSVPDNLHQIDLESWGGDVNLYYQTNLDNFVLIQNFIESWNAQSNTDYIYEPINVNLDTTDYGDINRCVYRQFIDNFNKINKFLPELCNDYILDDFEIVTPDIPATVNFDKDAINNYWTAVQNNVNHLIEQVEAQSVFEEV